MYNYTIIEWMLITMYMAAINMAWPSNIEETFLFITNVTNIVSTNISPRVQKDIIGFIGENVGKHRQYIGNVKKYKNIHFFSIF